MQTRSTLDTSSKNLFTNIERLGTRDLLSYEQLSYDTILTSIQIGQYPKNDIWRLYEIRARIYTLLQLPNENTNSLNNEHVNEEQEMIDSSSDNILIVLIAELYEHTKQSSTLPYEALLLLRPLSLLLAHISLSDRLMNKMFLLFFRALINVRYSAVVNEWTLLSMTNIAQRKSIGMAIWGLTCLTLSACLSHRIADALFSLMLSRFSDHFEELDNRLFLIAGREYYLQIL
ncbi:unnamed protein product [Rotaria sp. Silwood1]|nr:unnamed protein product [Rotaria sp. Silwood1]CAF1679174.1 unnamed protein product [Rotaria sp. Silwood1]